MPELSDANSLLLEATDLLRLTPDPNFYGQSKHLLTFRAWDQSTGAPGELGDTRNSGGTTAFSNVKDQIIFQQRTWKKRESGEYYALTSVPGKWTEAEAEAIARGGHLVTIKDATEQEFLVDTFMSNSQLQGPYWIGLADIRKEGEFVWSDGSNLKYQNWATGEPSDSRSTEDYVAINWHHVRDNAEAVGTWNDVPINGIGANAPYLGLMEMINHPPLLAKPDQALNAALSFSHLNSYIEVNGIPALGRDNFTLDIRLKTTDDEGTIISAYDSGNEGDFWRLALENGRVTFGFSNGFDTEGMAKSTTTVNDGQWHHIQGIRTDFGTGKLLIDGVEVDNFSFDVSQGKSIDTDTSVIIGNNSHGEDNFFQGTIDQLVITNNTQSREIAHWNFDSGKGKKIVDTSKNKYDGTIYGEYSWVYEKLPDLPTEQTIIIGNTTITELEIAPPFDLDSNDQLTITIKSLPDPDLGRIELVNSPTLAVGDTLTPEELASLRFYRLSGANGYAGDFRYTVNDGKEIVVANLRLEMVAANQAPLANPDVVEVQQNKWAIIDVLVNDLDPEADDLNVILVSQPTNGEIKLNPDGTIRYTHNGLKIFRDKFTYKLNDGELDSNITTVDIIIEPFNQPPEVEADKTIAVPEDTITDIEITTPTDANGDQLAIVIESLPEVSLGTIKLADGQKVKLGDSLTINQLSKLQFEPTPNAQGEAGTFSYSVSVDVL